MVIVKKDLERILPNDVFIGDWSGACGTDGWREPPTGERIGMGDSIGVPGMISQVCDALGLLPRDDSE